MLAYTQTLASLLTVCRPPHPDLTESVAGERKQP